MVASQMFSPPVTMTPISTEVAAMTLPTEMSISPPITTRVSVTAITPSTLTTLAAVRRFASVRK